MNTITTYQHFADNMQRGGGDGAIDACVRSVYLRLARDLDGFTALAISCAVHGEDPGAAAVQCSCTIAELDRAIASLATRITAGRCEVVA